jgi:uncharacterized protein YdeI (YjbR/CyaY-like superfamily)
MAKPNEPARFTPKSRRSWRKWLLEQHAKEAEVWLVFYKRHTGKPTLSYNDAVEEALCFGWIDGIKRRIDDERYMHRFSPRKKDSNWSATNRQRALRLQRVGSMTAAGLAAIELAKRSGKWDAPKQAIDLSMPPKLAAGLRKDKAAGQFFASLSAAQRHQFTGWINAAKRAETKQRRVQEAIRLLQRNEKLGMR